MREKSPPQKYEQRRRQITQNLKAKDHWPEGMKRPTEYRSFYWTNDLSFCGFATIDRQEKTIGIINKAMETKQ